MARRRKSRDYKLLYSNRQGQKLGRLVSCASETGVVRSACVRVFQGEADLVEVFYHQELIARITMLGGKLTYQSK